MTDTPSFRFPFVEELTASDGQTLGHPVVSERSRPAVEEFLITLLVDRFALREHVRSLQDYFRVARSNGVLTEWHHHTVLPKDVESAVLSKGPLAFKELDSETLASLVLNPSALLGLHDRLRGTLPVAWLTEISAQGRRFLRRNGVNIEEVLAAVQAGGHYDPEPEGGFPDPPVKQEEGVLAGHYGQDADASGKGTPAAPPQLPTRWEVQTSLAKAVWKAQDDPEQARQDLDWPVEVEYTWRIDATGPLLEQVFLGGPLRLGLTGASLAVFLCGPGDEPRIEGKVEGHMIRFNLPATLGSPDALLGWTTECEYHHTGKYEVLLRIPVRETQRNDA